MSGIFKNEGVSNNKQHRSMSDKADEAYFNDHPRQRAAVHGLYHAAVGVVKAVCGNTKGSSSEFKRSGEQFKNARSPSPK